MLRKAAWSDTSSSSSDSSTEQGLIANDVTEISLVLISPALKLAVATTSGETYSADPWCQFLASPAVAELMLQLLALRCLLMHKQHVQHQQQQGLALSRQLGKRMRGDLLPLADPRAQLLPLLPSSEFLAADAAALAAGDCSVRVHDVCVGLQALEVSIETATGSRLLNHPALSAASLQLSLQLLRMAAAYWQQHYHGLSEQQQTLLSRGAADVGHDRLAELSRLELQLDSALELLKSCMQLLHVQLSTLWFSGQWQPQLQLLQQGAGEVLLQGLTLVVHCSSLHCKMKTLDVFRVPELVSAVYQRLPGADGCGPVHANAASSTCLPWCCAHVSFGACVAVHCVTPCGSCMQLQPYTRECCNHMLDSATCTTA
jgi:hypothetical protein